ASHSLVEGEAQRGGETRSVGGGGRVTSNPRTRGLVLIADEDQASRSRASRILNNAGYATQETKGGEETLVAARRGPPRAVILEICLPDICGYEVCHELKEEFGEDLPIIFVTG